MEARAPLCLLCGDQADSLAKSVAAVLGQDAVPTRQEWFSCGEGKYVVDANVRGTDVYLFQRAYIPGGRSIYDQFMMVLHAVDAARHADAERVTVVLPYLPGLRQDKRKGHAREGVSTGLFARMLEMAGADMVITVEPHNDAVVGCYRPRLCVFEGVYIHRPFGRFLQAGGFVGDVVASTDVGGLEAARRYAELFGKGLVALSKERDYSQPNTVTRSTVIGDVRGRSVLIAEDIVDTGGSAASAVQALWAEGATDVTLACAHPLLSGPAWERLTALEAEGRSLGKRFRLVGTSSVQHKNAPEWYASFPLEGVLAEVVRQVHSRGSVRGVVEAG